MKSFVTLLLAAMAMLVPASHSRAEAWVVLRGERMDDAVRMAFELLRFEPGVVAFAVRRRAPGSAAWTPVASRIELGMWRDKDLSPVEPDPARREALRAALVSAIAAGGVEEVRSERFLETAARGGETFFRGLRREIFADYRRALWIGLGAYDRRASDRDTEYGLFPIRASGVAREPAAVYTAREVRPNDARLRVEGLEATPGDTGVALRWRFSEEAVQAWSIFGFRVLRGATPEALAPVRTDPIGGSRVAGGVREWSFVDREATPGASYVYAVEPVNVFGTTLDARTTVSLSPRTEPGAATDAPVIEAVAQASDGSVSVRWNVPEAAARPAGFRVERLALPSGAFEAISPVLPATERGFDDRAPKVDQAAFAYRVVAIASNGSASASTPQVLVYLETQTPPAPSSVTAQCIQSGNEQLIEVRWSPRDASDRVTQTYALFVDRPIPGTLVRQASVPETRGNEIALSVQSVSARTYRIGVAGVSERGQLGPITEASCKLAGLILAPPTDLAATLTPDGSALRVTWQVAGAERLAGFRISVNGVEQANELALDGGAREWSAARGAAASHYAIEVVAVATSGRASLPARIAWSPEQARPAAPDALTATWDPDAGSATVRLRWRRPAAEAEITAYLLSVDGAEEGRIEPAVRIEPSTPGEHRYSAVSRARRYTFHVRAVDRRGVRSRSATVTLEPPPDGAVTP